MYIQTAVLKGRHPREVCCPVLPLPNLTASSEAGREEWIIHLFSVFHLLLEHMTRFRKLVMFVPNLFIWKWFKANNLMIGTFGSFFHGTKILNMVYEFCFPRLSVPSCWAAFPNPLRRPAARPHRDGLLSQCLMVGLRMGLWLWSNTRGKSDPGRASVAANMNGSFSGRILDPRIWVHPKEHAKTRQGYRVNGEGALKAGVVEVTS